MHQRHRLRALGLLAALLAAPAMAGAGGPFEPPDGSGNGTGNDYTGFAIYGWVLGVNESPSGQTRFECTNFGLLEAQVAVQFYDTGRDPSRDPMADLFLAPSLPFSRVATGLSTDAIGRPVTHMMSIARIVIFDAAPRLTPAVQCRVYVQDKATGVPLAELKVVRPAPPKKKKKRRR